MPDPGPPSNVDPADAPPPPAEHTERPPKDEDTTLAVISLVLGLVGLFACQLLGPVGLFLGWSYWRSAKARGVEPDPMGIIGMVLGAVSTVFLVMTLCITGGVCVMYFGIFAISFIVAIAASAAPSP